MYYMHILLLFVTLWPVQISVLIAGALAGVLLPVRAAQWFQAALLFLAWGVMFESFLAIGLFFTNYNTRGSVIVHLVFMLYRLTFTVGMVAGLFLSDRRGWRIRTGGSARRKAVI